MPNKLNDSDLNPNTVLEKLTAMTTQEFLCLGADGLSYIKYLGAGENGNTLYALHSADGSHIATGQDMATLRIIAKQHNMLPMVVQ